MAGFDARIARLQARFPLANYGWRTEIMKARISRTGSGYRLVLPEKYSFDCKTTSRAAAHEFGGSVVGLRLSNSWIGSDAYFMHFIAAIKFGQDVCVVGLTPFDQVLGFYPYGIFPLEDFPLIKKALDYGGDAGVGDSSPRTIMLGHGSIPLEVVLSQDKSKPHPFLYMSSLSYDRQSLYPYLRLNIGAFAFDTARSSYVNPINIVIRRSDELGGNTQETGRYPSSESMRAMGALKERGVPVLEKIFSDRK